MVKFRIVVALSHNGCKPRLLLTPDPNHPISMSQIKPITGFVQVTPCTCLRYHNVLWLDILSFQQFFIWQDEFCVMGDTTYILFLLLNFLNNLYKIWQSVKLNNVRILNNLIRITEIKILCGEIFPSFKNFTFYDKGIMCKYLDSKLFVVWRYPEIAYKFI